MTQSGSKDSSIARRMSRANETVKAQSEDKVSDLTNVVMIDYDDIQDEVKY